MEGIDQKVEQTLDTWLTSIDRADGIKIYGYSKKMSPTKTGVREYYKCQRCKADIMPEKKHPKVLCVARFNWLSPETQPYQPQFTFHLNCLPKMADEFIVTSGDIERELNAWNKGFIESYREKEVVKEEAKPRKRVSKNPLKNRVRKIYGSY